MASLARYGNAKTLWRAFRLALGLVGLAALLGVVHPSELRAAFAQANWAYFPFAFLLSLLSTLVKTGRWALLLRQNQVRLPFRRLLGTYLIGAFYSQFLPGSSAGGDAMRMAESSVDTGQPVHAVASVLIERAIGMISILTTASLILFFIHPQDLPSAFSFTVYGLSLGGIIGLLVLRFGWFLDFASACWHQVGLGKVGQILRDLSAALQGDLGQGRSLLAMVALSLLANAFSMTSFYLLALAVYPPLPYLAFISVVALIVTLEIIPLTPGALGLREGAYVFFLSFLGVPEPIALTIGLLGRLLSWTQALMGGGILLQRIFSRPLAAPSSAAGD